MKFFNFMKFCLNVGSIQENGAPRAIRTPDRWYRKPVLYPAEL